MDIARGEELVFIAFRQQSALLESGVVAEEVTAAGHLAEHLADSNALVFLIFLAGNRLGANDLLCGRVAFTNTEVAAICQDIWWSC